MQVGRLSRLCISRRCEMVRRVGGLESAVYRPKTTVYGEEAYPTLELKIAALVHALARNRFHGCPTSGSGSWRPTLRDRGDYFGAAE